MSSTLSGAEVGTFSAFYRIVWVYACHPTEKPPAVAYAAITRPHFLQQISLRVITAKAMHQGNRVNEYVTNR